ncbi:MAG: hypothetical protein ACLPKB_29535 [Xanthobacteraceae bacterium]
MSLPAYVRRRLANSPSNWPTSDQLLFSRSCEPAVISALSGGGVAPLTTKAGEGSERNSALMVPPLL